MYLTRQRLSATYITDTDRAVFNELFPRGMEVTAERMARWIRRSPSLDVTSLAESTLTGSGYRTFVNRYHRVVDETRLAFEVGELRLKARRDLATARWRELHGIATSDRTTDEQQNELEAIRVAYLEGRNKLLARRNVKFAQVFAEVSVENASTRFANKPTIVKLKPGEVLVTSGTLATLGSCGTYISRFADRFPEGSPINEDVCVQNADSFDWMWAADRLLGSGGMAAWEQTRAELFQEFNVTQRRSDARKLYDERIRALDNAYASGLISSTQRSEKQRRIESGYHEYNETLDADELAVNARAFARVYAVNPRPGLADLA